MDDTVNHVLHPEAVLLQNLLTREGRREQGLMIIDDEENVLEALRAGVRVQTIYATEGVPPVSPPFQGQRFRLLSWRTAKKIFGTERASRFLAVAEIPPQYPLQEVIHRPGDWVLVEDLAISGNIGAIIRTSLALGAAGLLAVGKDVDLTDRRLVRASRGYLFRLPVVVAPLGEALRAVKASRKCLVLATAHGDETVSSVSDQGRDLVFAFGSEKDGPTAELESAADRRVRIDMQSEVESLNVSVSVGILLFGRLSRRTALGSLKA